MRADGRFGQSRKEVIRCLARAAEFRDDDTGRHIVRVGRYAHSSAKNWGLKWKADMLEQAGPTA